MDILTKMNEAWLDCTHGSCSPLVTMNKSTVRAVSDAAGMNHVLQKYKSAEIKINEAIKGALFIGIKEVRLVEI